MLILHQGFLRLDYNILQIGMIGNKESILFTTYPLGVYNNGESEGDYHGRMLLPQDKGADGGGVQAPDPPPGDFPW